MPYPKDTIINIRPEYAKFKPSVPKKGLRWLIIPLTIAILAILFWPKSETDSENSTGILQRVCNPLKTKLPRPSSWRNSILGVCAAAAVGLYVWNGGRIPGVTPSGNRYSLWPWIIGLTGFTSLIGASELMDRSESGWLKTMAHPWVCIRDKIWRTKQSPPPQKLDADHGSAGSQSSNHSESGASGTGAEEQRSIQTSPQPDKNLPDPPLQNPSNTSGADQATTETQARDAADKADPNPPPGSPAEIRPVPSSEYPSTSGSNTITQHHNEEFPTTRLSRDDPKPARPKSASLRPKPAPVWSEPMRAAAVDPIRDNACEPARPANPTNERPGGMLGNFFSNAAATVRNVFGDDDKTRNNGRPEKIPDAKMQQEKLKNEVSRKLGAQFSKAIRDYKRSNKRIKERTITLEVDYSFTNDEVKALVKQKVEDMLFACVVRSSTL